MAAGFKSATVNSGSVPATQTNFPSYVDLSRLGITTLAEAQSVRVYAEEAKTTEWAREIVSATEMHVKVPSLTSTTAIYVDWDGVRSDYSVSDTYGRNAVWSGAAGIWHLQEASGTRYDSKGVNDLSDTNTVLGATGRIGGGADFEKDNAESLNKVSPTGLPTGASPRTFSAIFKTESNVACSLAGYGTFTEGYLSVIHLQAGGAGVDWYGFFDDVNVSHTITPGTWYHLHFTYDGTNARVYIDAVLKATVAKSWNTQLGNFAIGENATNNDEADAVIDEVRLVNSALSANWITTEYNNQSDEAGFWGTWTTVSAGSTFIPRVMALV